MKHIQAGGMAWTASELYAIAEGATAAERLGVIPQSLAGAARLAWRHGFARGWNGLGSGVIDLPEFHTAKEHWDGGWLAGNRISWEETQRPFTRADADAQKRAVQDFAEADPTTWTSAQRRAYEDGVAHGRSAQRAPGAKPKPSARYRGRLREFALIWQMGWRTGMGLEEVGAPRWVWPAETDEAAPQPLPDADGVLPREPGPAAPSSRDRHRASAARTDTVQVEISGRTRDLLDEICRRTGRPRAIVLEQMALALRREPGSDES